MLYWSFLFYNEYENRAQCSTNPLRGRVFRLWVGGESRDNDELSLLVMADLYSPALWTLPCG
jgi:hypothetical protein